MKERAPRRIAWETGRLWQKLKAQSEYGLSTGALQSIETAIEYINAHGVRFLVHTLKNLSRKEKARQQQGKTTPANPFLPYEQDLYVTDISETHLCLLNKFRVVDHHFLIVTRRFEPQENWLTLADFEALVRCLSEVNGLAFFNGGKAAGASQPHKHLQIVPYTDALTAFPMESVITLPISQKQDEEVVTASLLPFRHAIAYLNTPPSPAPIDQQSIDQQSIDQQSIDQQSIDQSIDQQPTAQEYLRQYHKLLGAVGIASTATGIATGTTINATIKATSQVAAQAAAQTTARAAHWQGPQTAAYNLLCTRQWMMLIPRSQEKYADISVNSLGFAGSLLVKNKASLARLKMMGPMQLLQQVSWPQNQSLSSGT